MRHTNALFAGVPCGATLTTARHFNVKHEIFDPRGFASGLVAPFRVYSDKSKNIWINHEGLEFTAKRIWVIVRNPRDTVHSLMLKPATWDAWYRKMYCTNYKGQLTHADAQRFYCQQIGAIMTYAHFIFCPDIATNIRENAS